jgi:glutathione S-transferase
MMIEPPQLFSFRRCPYAMRARMALQIAQIPVQTVEVNLKNKPESLLKASPKATVPVLILSSGQILDESLDIMHWALTQSDPEHWLKSIDQALIAQNDGPFKHHLDRAKYKASLPDRESALAILHSLNARLETSAHLSRPTRSFTDVALMPFIRQFAAVDRAWFAAQPLPHLQRWLATFESSKLFTTIMAKSSPPASPPAP